MFNSSRGFLPFSKSFLNEVTYDQENEEEQGARSREGISQTPRNSPTLTSQLPFKTLDCGNGTYVASFAWETTVFISGYCKIICLKGRVSVDGYFLGVGEELALRKSTWYPAVQIRIKKGKSLRKLKTPDKILNEYKIKANLKEEQSCLLITSLECGWMEVTDSIPFKRVDASNLLPYNGNNINISNKWKTEYQLLTGSFQLATESIFSKQKCEITNFPTTWDSAIYQLTDSYLHHKQLKILICGSKGVGKSSLLRYVVNSHLNVSGIKQSPICLIDCDLGQPELTVPGMVSLHIVDFPLISSHHFNLQQPKLGFFIGDVSSRNEPELFCAALRRVFSYYLKLREEYKKDRFKEFRSSNKAPSNPFSLLLEEEKSEKINESDLDNCLPLVINTDGYVRYMGAEILAAIVDIIQPTDILHVSSNQEPTLPLLQQIALNDPGVNITALESPLLFAQPPNTRPIAAELRNLRFLSYFLRKLPIDGSVSFRNAALMGSGNDGLLSWFLLNQCSYIIPFHLITFNIKQESITPSQILSIMNGTIVGISFKENVEQWPSQSEKSTKLQVRGRNDTQFNLAYFSPFSVVEMEGLGIVTSIDLSRKCLTLITPQAINTSQQIVLTVGGGVSLPYYVGYGEGFPSLPYYSSEFCGEGSSQLKPRTNLKRKGQENS